MTSYSVFIRSGKKKKKRKSIHGNSLDGNIIEL